MRRWLFSLAVVTAMGYLGYEVLSVVPFIRTVVTALQTPNARTSVFLSEAVWPSAATDSVPPSPADLEIARIVLLDLAETGRAQQTTVIGVMNDHGVNPSWYRWIRPYLATQPEFARTLARVDDAWLLSSPIDQP